MEMRRLLCIALLSFLVANTALSQQSDAARLITTFKLPAQLASDNWQFSGLEIAGDKLYMLAENRLDKEKEGSRGIAAVDLSDIRLAITDTGYAIPAFQFFPLEGLEATVDTIVGYEGLEAFSISGNKFYATIETDTFNLNAYLIGGDVTTDRFIVDPAKLLAIPKKLRADGRNYYNASYESLQQLGDKLFAVFEYNYQAGNYGYLIDTSFTQPPVKIAMSDSIPFRITDIDLVDDGTLVGINRYYPSGGERYYMDNLSLSDRNKLPPNANLSFTRLAMFSVSPEQITLTGYRSLPETLWRTNWEGIKFFEEGILMVNDRYANPGRKTELVYLKL